MYCPKCGSTNITEQAVTNTNTYGTTKGFGWIKACLGYLLFNIPGILCGLCGMGKSRTTTTTSTTIVHVCKNCGHRF